MEIALTRSRNLPVVIPAALLTPATLACLCSSQAKPTQPTAAMAPLVLRDDLTLLDVCRAIPQEDVEAVPGVKVVGFGDQPNEEGALALARLVLEAIQ
jgi:hypothetical protein